MLVLSRGRDETIMIGDDIEITIVDIRGDKVRLGITAPKGLSIHRKEVYDAIRQENYRAEILGSGEGSILSGVSKQEAVEFASHSRKLVGWSIDQAAKSSDLNLGFLERIESGDDCEPGARTEALTKLRDTVRVELAARKKAKEDPTKDS